MMSFTIIAFFLPAASFPADAAVFTCPSGDVSCLIKAINYSNAAPGEHTITLDEGTYTLTGKNNITDGSNGLPSITGDVQITGRGIDKTILKRDKDAIAFFRIFHVSPAGSLTLEGLNVTGGMQQDRLDPILLRSAGGGGIYNRGILNVTNCRISDNSDSFQAGPDGSGGGIYNTGTAIIKNSMLTGNYAGDFGTGGAVYSSGILIVEKSTFRNNSAVGLAGGAVYNTGDADISNTFFTRNWTDSGGAILNAGYLSIANSTFYANQAHARGGAIAVWGASTVTISTNNTFYRNHAITSGGGIATDGKGLIQLQNTILARNEISVGPGMDCYGQMVSLGNNFIGNLAGCTVNILPTDKDGDPILGEFIDSDIPGSAYVPLLPDSIVVDAGNNAVCWTLPKDQIGNPRIIDGDYDGTSTCDIGAIEYVPTEGLSYSISPGTGTIRIKRPVSTNK